MQVTRHNNELILRFGAMEKELFLQTSDAILKNYRLTPGEIDAKTRAVWYSTRGCKSAGMSAEETREWVENLFSFKGANAKQLERWTRKIKKVEPAKEVQPPPPAQFELALTLEEAASLVTIINDHRLHLAAKYDIGERELEPASWSDTEQLTPDQQSALVQIELLGWMIEVILRLIAPDAASWRQMLESPDELA